MTLNIASRAAKTAQPKARNPYALKALRPSRMPWIFMALLGGIALYFRSAAPDDPQSDSAGAPPQRPVANSHPANAVAPAGFDFAQEAGAPDAWFASALRAGPGDRVARPGDEAPFAEWLAQAGGVAPQSATGPSFAALYGSGAGLAATASDMLPGIARPSYARVEVTPPDPRPEFEPLDFGTPGFALDLPLA